ncbi:putative MscS family protein YfkC [Salinivirga cyanobacteriivorans]|uniref:Putative MscS family protein YfkC n=1 Tax=Salinivirga cyanobacteriivorans TaxID=1307839 RepID=A0A0S2HYD8_9BACT|nr:mechanosensitive ion channel domain-containing protein [Salinivirga cyanobacteriivorans]ALO15012.1 putative MscS family protein YfkC [Salinivirga cyanobacteriivorans]
MKKYFRIIISLLLLIYISVLEPFFRFLDIFQYLDVNLIRTLQKALIIACSSWVIIEFVHILKNRLLKRFDISEEDNLKSRKLHTQINLIEKVIVFLIIITGIGLILLSIESIRQIGVGIFASAGVVGIIIGLSAQKIVGALLAGIQIAITQPFRVDDAVLVENEWGWIEEINLTYIVVRIWDKRRLVLPTTYFIEKPFQNWTRNTADIIGTVFLYTDYTISFDALRKELTRLLNSTELWDQKVNVLQVTDTKETTVEIRILVSAKNSPTAWDLRVYIREKMIEFIQKNYPQCLPKTRLLFDKADLQKHGYAGEQER